VVNAFVKTIKQKKLALNENNFSM